MLMNIIAENSKGGAMMKIKISKRWIRNKFQEPDGCMSCPEELNGINYGWIEVNGLKIWINLCDDCLNKLNSKELKGGKKK